MEKGSRMSSVIRGRRVFLVGSMTQSCPLAFFPTVYNIPVTQSTAKLSVEENRFTVLSFRSRRIITPCKRRFSKCGIGAFRSTNEELDEVGRELTNDKMSVTDNSLHSSVVEVTSVNRCLVLYVLEISGVRSVEALACFSSNIEAGSIVLTATGNILNCSRSFRSSPNGQTDGPDLKKFFQVTGVR